MPGVRAKIQKWLSRLICVFALFFPGNSVLAQLSLSINGKDAHTVETVSGYTYISLQELANLFYADYSEHGTDSLSLILYGHLFEFQISEASQATQNTGALRFNGQVKASTSAVRLANSVYLPLRPIIEVLGGNIHYVADQQKIIAVTPRPDFLGGRVISSGAADRLILSFSHPVAFRQIQDAILNTVVLTVEASSSQPFWQEEGTYLNLVQLNTLPGQLNVSLELSEDVSYEIFTSLEEDFSVIVDVFPGEPEQDYEVVQVQIDYDDELLERFADMLNNQLLGNQIRTYVTSYRAFSISDAAVSIRIQVANLAFNSFNINYPQELATGNLLGEAVQQQTPPADLEGLFESLETDYFFIERQADLFARSLESASRYVLNDFSSAPIALNTVPADSVIILEVSESSLLDEAFLIAVASALGTILNTS